MDLNVRSTSRAVPSSLGSDRGDQGVRRTHTIPQTNPNAKSARPMKPAGTPTVHRKHTRHQQRSQGDRGESGDEVCHMYAVPNLTPPPPNPDEHPPPPSMPLKVENYGERSSGHVYKMGMHLEQPQAKLTTTPPIRMPHDKESSGED
ncbi:hypothetical protein PAXRUDRAFT_19191 [Paxillus rubicundulus Ve08.2h10]|uniref:Uncharacterized protein n=1 Tax=Paxillus rubicundulus Ve08.2h10 TaxID=930991 RepID=A0A0D0CVS7_9AGAM|nr:hypothetical protein PAXRUDRAFT_19191 [Paxillus rubicundulus Ve08.2h10]